MEEVGLWLLNALLFVLQILRDQFLLVTTQ